MPPSFDIREASADDYEPLFNLHAALFKAQIEQIWGWDEVWQRENFAEEWSCCRARVIESAGRPVGCVLTKQETDHLYLLSIGLIEGFQGKGIGGEIMKALQNEAFELSLPLRLSTFRINPRALAFYQRLGFKITGATETSDKLEWHPLSDICG